MAINDFFFFLVRGKGGMGVVEFGVEGFDLNQNSSREEEPSEPMIFY